MIMAKKKKNLIKSLLSIQVLNSRKQTTSQIEKALVRFHCLWASVSATHLRQVESLETSCRCKIPSTAHCLYIKGPVTSQMCCRAVLTVTIVT